MKSIFKYRPDIYFLSRTNSFNDADKKSQVFILPPGQTLLIIFRLCWCLRSDMKRNLDKITLMDLFVGVDTDCEMVAGITMFNLHQLIKHQLSDACKEF